MLTKPVESRLGIEKYVNKLAATVLAEIQTTTEQDHKRLEDVLAGLAIELWSDALGERFWLVADEKDASLLGEPRGAIYTAAEARLVIRIADSDVVAEVHRWKREFNARLGDVLSS